MGRQASGARGSALHPRGDGLNTASVVFSLKGAQLTDASRCLYILEAIIRILFINSRALALATAFEPATGRSGAQVSDNTAPWWHLTSGQWREIGFLKLGNLFFFPKLGAHPQPEPLARGPPLEIDLQPLPTAVSPAAVAGNPPPPPPAQGLPSGLSLTTLACFVPSAGNALPCPSWWSFQPRPHAVTTPIPCSLAASLGTQAGLTPVAGPLLRDVLLQPQPQLCGLADLPRGARVHQDEVGVVVFRGQRGPWLPPSSTG